MIAIWTPCTVVRRSVLMSVIMTFMLEPAKLQINCAESERHQDLPQRQGATL